MSQRPSSPSLTKIHPWLPALHPQVWLMATGRLLSQVGSGFTLFSAPVFFVNHVGLSATAVGIGLGSASISGVFGRLAGGSLLDAPRFGRRRTLLLSALVSMLASLVLAIAFNFPIFVLGNLLMGLGIGLYWPATETVVADLTPPTHRNEAYALTRLADNLGLGLGVVLGGILIGTTGAYRALFVIDAISFLVFFGLVYVLIGETAPKAGETERPSFWQGWAQALGDRPLLIFVVLNCLLTTYIAQIQTTLPLYFSNFVTTPTSKGFPPLILSALFTWHMAIAILCQLPIARALNRWSRPHALMVSAGFWALGFSSIWLTGMTSTWAIAAATLSLGLLGLAVVTYTPAASSFVADLAPPQLRGVYLAINSQCWAVGYFLGPTLGGFAMDQPRPLADSFWLALAASTFAVIAVLQILNQHTHPSPPPSTP